MKVTKIAFKNLDNEQPSVPGNFILEIYPEPEPAKGERSIYDTGMLGWSEKAMGTVTPGDLLPGCTKTYSLTDWKPPILAFQIHDYSHPSIQEEIAAAEIPADTRKRLDAEQKEQLTLKLELKAPTVASALMTKLLATLVSSEAITPDFAKRTLTEQLGLGPSVAQGLVKRGTEYIARQQHTVH